MGQRNNKKKIRENESLVDTIINDARQLYYDDLYQQALEKITEVPESKSNHVLVLDLKGFIFTALEKYQEALKSFLSSIEKNGNRFEPHKGKAFVLKQLYRHEESQKVFDESILKIKSEDSEAKTKKAICIAGKASIHSELEENKEAEELFNEAIAIDRNCLSAWCGKGNLAKKLGQYDQAEKYFLQAININQEYMDAHSGLGYLFIKQAMELEYEESRTEDKEELLLNKALEKFEFVIENKENYAEGYNGKGYALLKIAKNLDQKKAALEFFERAIELKPEYFEALENRASILREIEDDNFREHFGISYNVISDDWYQQSDIAAVANIILSRNVHSNNQFEIIGNIDSEARQISDNNHLKSFLSSTRTPNLENNPLFVIYNKNGNHWVTFCITEDKGQKIVLYKDSFGSRIPFELENIISEHFSEDIKFKSHCKKEQYDDHSCGPMSLANMEIIMQGLKNNKETFIKQFINQTFTKQHEVKDIKAEFQSEISPDFISKINEYISEIKNNEDFIKSVKDFAKRASKYSHLAEKVNNYNKSNQEEMKKPEATRDYAKLYEDNKLTLPDTDKSADEIKNNNKELEKTQNKYAQEFSKLEKALDIAFRVKDSQALDSLLNSIGEDLGIDIEQIKNFKKTQNDNSNMEDKEDVFLKPKDINKLQQLYEKSEAEGEGEEAKTSTAKNDHKPLGQLLHELILGSDKDYIKNGKQSLSVEEIANYRELELNDTEARAEYETLYKDQSEILNIIKQYYTVKEHIKTFESFSPNKILSWANDIKGNLTNDAGDICKTIAIMDRAYNLAFEGKNLRDTQILSTLIFLNNEKDCGRLCEIKTGEGKTTIVALLATINAMQGKSVDIITSNSVLAGEGAEKNQDFYSLFGLTVATNNSDKEDTPALGPNSAYTADILYGNISNFQFDYLRDSFEGLGTRAERDFGTVIIDEVDSMLIDNGSHIAKLSGPMPGMENLRYIYVEIWKTLQKVLMDIEESDNKKIEQLKTNYSDNKIEKDEFLKSLNDIIYTKNDRVKADIKSKLGNFADEKEIIPSHVQSYIDAKLEKWIDLAIRAAYDCEEDKQYKIETNAEGEKVIVPVDYANTGVTMKNTIWSEGLHQFVQLKHQLHLTPESLTSSFISNLGYINKYGNKIYGLTGTLGSIAEQDLLSQIYNLNYAKISTFKEKKFQELEGQIVSDDEWSNLVAIDALLHTDHRRAVLVVCQTISDLKKLHKTLELLEEKGLAAGIKIITYEDESKSDFTKDPLDSGTIVLATNIAGRGTDFGTTPQVEDAGGLHVCVGFLPCNKRVEDQAFGRTSRQGKKGTAKLIIKQSEVDKLPGGKEIDYQDIELIKTTRDQDESKRIEDIKNNKVGELNFQDEIFEKFSKLYRSIKDNLEEASARYVLKDLKDFWAFWLDKQEHKGEGLTTSQVQARADEKFEEFNKLPQISQYQEGKIQFNPYYAIKQSEYFLRRDKQDEAEKVLHRALEIGENSPEALYAANFKLFEISLQKGNVTMNFLKKALARCFFFSVKMDDSYKVDAKSHLKATLKGIKKEIDYIEKKFFTQNEPENQEQVVNNNNQFDKVLKTYEIFHVEASEDISTAEHPSPEEQEESEEKDKVPFYIHLESKYYALLMYKHSIEGLITQIDESKDNGLSISSRITDYLENLKSEESGSNDNQIIDYIDSTEVHQLSTNGLDTSYGVNEKYHVPQEITTGAQIQILGGMSLFPLTIFCPALFHVATTMISEGVCDVVIELIQQGQAGFDGTEYAKGKTISYGTSFATMGISKVASAIKLLKTASKTSAGISKNLSKNKTMIDSLKKVASQIEKTKAFNVIKKNASDMIDHLSDLNKVPPGKLAKSKELAKSLVLDVTNSIVMEKVVTASLDEILNSLRPKIKAKVKHSVNNNLDKNALKSKDQENINSMLEDLITGDFNQIASEVGGEIASGVARHAGGAKLKAFSLTVDGLGTFNQVMGYTKGFCKKLTIELDKENSDSSDNKKSADQMLEEISDKVAEKIYGMIQHFTGKVANTAIVMPAISGIMKSFDHQPKNKHDYKVKQDKPKKNSTEGSDSISNKGNTDIDIGQTHTILNTPEIIKSINSLETLSNVADYNKSIKRADALRSSQLQQFGGAKSQVDDTASGGNCRQIGMSQLFNDKEGVHKHTVSSIVRDYTMTPTPGNLKQLDKILQTRYQDTALIGDTLSPLEIKSWMQDNKFNSCLIAIEFDNPITVNGQNVKGHVTFARLEDGQIIISDKQRDANGKVLTDMSMTDYFTSTGIDPKCIHVRQLIDGASTRPILVTESGKLSGEGVADIKSNHDQMRPSLDDSNCMDVEQQNHSSRRDSTDMDVDFGGAKKKHVTKESQGHAIARAKSPEGQEWMQKAKQNSPDIKEFKPLDKHDLSNIAEYEKIHIQTHSTDGDIIHEFGKEYSANKTIIMVYEPAQGTNEVGHYRAVGQKPSTPIAKNSCAHDILAKALGKELIDIDIIAACTRHEYCGIDIDSNDTLQTINKKLQQANNEHGLGGAKLQNAERGFYVQRIEIQDSDLKQILDKAGQSRIDQPTTLKSENAHGHLGDRKPIDTDLHHIIPESVIRNNLRTLCETDPPKAKNLIQRFINKTFEVRQNIIQIEGASLTDKGANADIILQHLLWHPNNLVAGPNEGKFRGVKPKNEIDSELLKMQTKKTQEFFQKLNELKANPEKFFEKYITINQVKIQKVGWVLGDSKKKQDRDKYYVDDRPKNIEITEPENPVGEGMFEYSVDSFWNKYFKVSMEKILNLRLIQNKVEDVEVLTCSIIDKGVFDIRDELVDHINSSDHIKILIPTNISNKHWVGLFIEKKEESTNIVYIDPENRNIPKHILHELSFILSRCNGLTHVEISQTNVEQQKYNNCGPEVIENFMLLLSDTRFSQESAVIEHSHLLEQNLLHYCSENQLSGCVLDYYEYESGS